MRVRFSASYRDEFDYFNEARAQAWLRGKGIDDALVYCIGNNVFVEVAMGTPSELLAEAVRQGCVV